MASFLKVCPVRYGRCKMCMYTNKRDYYKRLFEQGLELSEDFFFDGDLRLIGDTIIAGGNFIVTGQLILAVFEDEDGIIV